MFPSYPPSLRPSASIRAAGVVTALATTLGVLTYVDVLARPGGLQHEPAVATASEAVRCGPVHPDS